MTDGYWTRQQPSHLSSSAAMLKRPRYDYELPSSGLSSSYETYNYYSRDDDRARYETVKDSKTIGSAYDFYLQNSQVRTFGSGDASALKRVGLGRAVDGGMTGLPLVDSAIMGRPRATGLDLVPNGRDIGFGGQRHVDTIARPDHETVPLPPDASNTLYVEGFPPDCRRREVAHIFRPFVGYKEVRLVSKESKHRGGDPIILCFVDFSSPAYAATAMSALQGYIMDEHDPDSKRLRVQFSRYPGPRSGSGSRGRR